MIAALFSRRIRGFRVVEMAALALLLVLVLVVYLGKTFAGRERTEIARVERQIAQEKTRVRLLQAEVAYLEQPERLERLARQHLGMEPAGARHEADADALTVIAAREARPQKISSEATP